MCEAFVEFDYTAQEQDELTMRTGDIIKDVTTKQPGWCEGVLNEKRGVFPENFVKFIDKDVIKFIDKDVTYRNKKDSSTVRQCRVIFSYQPVHPDELLLTIGDTIDIIGEDEEGWWRGTQNGKEGVFPSNFVEEIFPSKPKAKSSSREDLPTVDGEAHPRIPNLPPKPAKILCEVKYAYKAQNDDELSLKEGDIITLTNRELADPGWWEGELSGKIGVFPDNFVNIIKQSEDKLHKDDSKYTKVTPDSVPLKAPIATVSQRISLEPKNEVESKTNPPLIHKKPLLPKKKSPSSVTKGFLSGIVSRKSDSVDGSTSSKSQQGKTDVKVDVKIENVGENAFDQVERNPLLKDVRAGRAKPPIRRPPTSVVKDKSPAFESEEGIISEEEAPETKPQVREWEKHKAPWLEEMKMNQAKRSSTSPISEKNLNTKGLYPELDKSPIDNVMSKSMPCPVTSKTSPNELVENMTPPSSSISKVKPNNLQNLIRNNFSNADIPLFNNTTNAVSPKATNVKPSIDSNLSKPKTTSNEKCNNGEKLEDSSRASGEFAQTETMNLTLSVQQYSDILTRIQRLEILVERQTTTIEDLKAKLYIEWDKRRLYEGQKLTQ